MFGISFYFKVSTFEVTFLQEYVEEKFGQENREKVSANIPSRRPLFAAFTDYFVD